MYKIIAIHPETGEVYQFQYVYTEREDAYEDVRYLESLEGDHSRIGPVSDGWPFKIINVEE
jgi:hypothetical protein